MYAEDICNACYFIWGHNEIDAESILENIVHWPPFQIIESEMIDVHKPLALSRSIEQQLGLPPLIGKKHTDGMREVQAKVGKRTL